MQPLWLNCVSNEYRENEYREKVSEHSRNTEKALNRGHTQYLAADPHELPPALPGRFRPVVPDDLGAETGV